MKRERLLVLDATNNFIRNYVINPTLSPNGEHIGGIVGFLKSLQKIIRETKPDRVIICWDGPGGSLRRKQTNNNYKEGRSPLRLNRSIKGLHSQEQEMENKLFQQMRLFEYLNTTPVIQLLFENIEADDLVAYVVKHEEYKEWVKIIVSSDKDFFQLLNETTLMYRPIQDEVLTVKNIVDKYEIHPNNFAIARAMSGDKSDNLDGIKGVGLPTVSKRFPLLKEEKCATIDELIDYSDRLEKKYKIHEILEENKDLVLSNYKMMNLANPQLDYDTVKKVDNIIDNIKLSFNQTEFTKKTLQDGFAEVNFIEMFAAFKRFVAEDKE